MAWSAPPWPSRGPEAPLASRLAAIGLLAALVVAATVTGLVLVELGTRFHPGAVVALPLAAVSIPFLLRRPTRGIAVALVALPAGLVPVAFGLQVVHVATAVAVLAGAGALLNQARTPLGWHPACWWALFLLASAIVATAGAIDRVAAANYVVLLAAGVLLVLVTLAAAREQAQVRWLTAVFLAAATVMCAASLSSVGEGEAAYGGAVVTGRAEGIFTQPNQLGSFAALVLIVAIGFVLSSTTRAERLGGSLAALSALVAMLLSLSRGAWLGAALGVAGLVVLLPAARRPLVAAAVPLLLVAGFAGAFRAEAPQVELVRARLGTVGGDRLADNPYDTRDIIVSEGMRQAREHPWFGVGPANFAAAAERTGSEIQTVAPSHAHNALLNVAAEAGFAAALFLVGLTLTVGAAAAGAVRHQRPRQRALTAGLACGLLTAVGHGLVDHPWGNPVLLVTVWVVVGLTLAASRISSSTHPAPPSTRVSLRGRV